VPPSEPAVLKQQSRCRVEESSISHQADMQVNRYASESRLSLQEPSADPCFSFNASVTDMVAPHVLSLAELERPGRPITVSSRRSCRCRLRIYPTLGENRITHGLWWLVAGFLRRSRKRAFN
jgi:hypothetical protein